MEFKNVLNLMDMPFFKTIIELYYLTFELFLQL